MTSTQYCFRGVLALLAFAVCAQDSAAQNPDEGETVSTRAGVFTAAQVEAGDELFKSVCLDCHDTFEFAGSGYLLSWEGAFLFELYDYIATKMPEDNPGSMKAGEYAAVLAYILKENGLPTGETALTGDEELLKRILIEAPEEVGRPQHGSLILRPSR